MRRSKVNIMLRLARLAKPLLHIMIIAITMGVAGFLCAEFITILGGYAALNIIGFETALPLGGLFILLGVTALLRGIADYSAGLAVFMDIDSMRELFGQEDDYYNMLLSDSALDIDEGRLYSVTTRSNIERSSAVFTELMMPMVIMFSVVSVIIFCVVMYLMMNVMIDRASFGISLVKIFGYRTGEVRKLYLNGNTIVVAVGALIAIPALISRTAPRT